MVNTNTSAGSETPMFSKRFIAWIVALVAGLFVSAFAAGILISRSIYG